MLPAPKLAKNTLKKLPKAIDAAPIFRYVHGMENNLLNRVKQLGQRIMSEKIVCDEGVKFQQLSGWLVGYVSENNNIGDLQKIKILEKVAQLQ